MTRALSAKEQEPPCHSLPARLQLVEVQPRRHSLSGIISRIPLHQVVPGAPLCVFKQPHQSTSQIKDPDEGARRLRQVILDGREAAEWIGLVLVQTQGKINPPIPLNVKRGIRDDDYVVEVPAVGLGAPIALQRETDQHVAVVAGRQIDLL
jgi:hypothetical protein